jgi:DNA repair protein RadC
MPVIVAAGIAGLGLLPRSTLGQVKPSGDARSQAGADARIQLVVANRAQVAFWERELARTLQLRARRSVGDHEVNVAQINLARARHDLALAERKPRAALVEQHRVIVNVRQEELKRLQQLRGRGAVSAAEIAAAQRRLASARYRLASTEEKPAAVATQLRQIIAICEQELGRLLKLSRQRGASETEVAIGRCRLAYARYRLALAETRTKDVVEQLRLLVSLHQQEFKRLQRLAARRAAAIDEVNDAEARLLEARQRLALAEQKPEEVIAQLRLLVALNEKRLKRALAFAVEEEEIVSIRWALAHDHDRLVLAGQNMALSADDPAEELEGAYERVHIRRGR